jgi:ferredoxin
VGKLNPSRIERKRGREKEREKKKRERERKGAMRKCLSLWSEMTGTRKGEHCAVLCANCKKCSRKCKFLLLYCPLQSGFKMPAWLALLNKERRRL